MQEGWERSGWGERWFAKRPKTARDTRLQSNYFSQNSSSLRQARGSKISKLWIKSKMKNTIGNCYGKEEADKAGDNWFQRFKRRNNTSLRRKTSKKRHFADDAREAIQIFHQNLRRAVQSKRRRSRPEGRTMDAKTKVQCWSSPYTFCCWARQDLWFFRNQTALGFSARLRSW